MKNNMHALVEFQTEETSKKVFEEFREEQREGEKILDDFKTECNRLKDDVANSRIEVHAEISRGSEQISEEHNMALKMCENEINQIERVLLRMEELHRERMEEVEAFDLAHAIVLEVDVRCGVAWIQTLH